MEAQATLFVGAVAVLTAHAVHVVPTSQVEHLTGQALHVALEPAAAELYLPAAHTACA